VKKWIQQHPLKAGVFLLLFSGAGTHLVVNNDDLMFWGAWATLTAAWMIVARRDGVAWLVVLALLAPDVGRSQALPPAPPLEFPEHLIEDPLQLEWPLQRPGLQAAAGGLVAGGIVLAGGGLALWALVKYCKKHFCKVSTNALPAITNAVDADSVWNASYIDPAFGYCLSAASWETPYVVTLTVTADGGAAALTGVSISSEFGTMEGWTNAAAFLGLSLTNGPAVSRNGVPVYPHESPLRLTTDRVWVFTDGLPILIERSADLVSWERVVWISVRHTSTNIITFPDEGDRLFFRMSYGGEQP
jgi:hypothetical protein